MEISTQTNEHGTAFFRVEGLGTITIKPLKRDAGFSVTVSTENNRALDNRHYYTEHIRGRSDESIDLDTMIWINLVQEIGLRLDAGWARGPFNIVDDSPDDMHAFVMNVISNFTETDSTVAKFRVAANKARANLNLLYASYQRWVASTTDARVGQLEKERDERWAASKKSDARIHELEAEVERLKRKNDELESKLTAATEQPRVDAEKATALSRIEQLEAAALKHSQEVTKNVNAINFWSGLWVRELQVSTDYVKKFTGTSCTVRGEWAEYVDLSAAERNAIWPGIYDAVTKEPKRELGATDGFMTNKQALKASLDVQDDIANICREVARMLLRGRAVGTSTLRSSTTRESRSRRDRDAGGFFPCSDSDFHSFDKLGGNLVSFIVDCALFTAQSRLGLSYFQTDCPELTLAPPDQYSSNQAGLVVAVSAEKHEAVAKECAFWKQRASALKVSITALLETQ